MQTSPPIEEFIPADAKRGERGVRENIYVWELPVRITHWVNVISIGILTVTGIYIANPFMGTTGPAVNQYLMGSIRFTHFVTAFVFTMSVLVRIYWAFVGNKYASWRQLLPTKYARRAGIRRMLGFYLFIKRKAPAVVGHNPLAGSAYTVLFLLYLTQIITGFALYALPFHGGIWPGMFGWVTYLFGVGPTRLLHDTIMWLILAFVVHHVYTAILIDIEEQSGLMSSIFSGFKALTHHQIEEAYLEETQQPRRRRVRNKHVS